MRGTSKLWNPEKLKKIRKNKKLSCEEIARKINERSPITTETYRKIEKNKSIPRIDTYLIICDILEIPITSLLS